MAYLDAVLDDQDAFPRKGSGGGGTEVIQRPKRASASPHAQVNEIVEKAVADARAERWGDCQRLGGDQPLTPFVPAVRCAAVESAAVMRRRRLRRRA